MVYIVLCVSGPPSTGLTREVLINTNIPPPNYQPMDPVTSQPPSLGKATLHTYKHCTSYWYVSHYILYKLMCLTVTCLPVGVTMAAVSVPSTTLVYSQPGTDLLPPTVSQVEVPVPPGTQITLHTQPGLSVSQGAVVPGQPPGSQPAPQHITLAPQPQVTHTTYLTLLLCLFLSV